NSSTTAKTVSVTATTLSGGANIALAKDTSGKYTGAITAKAAGKRSVLKVTRTVKTTTTDKAGKKATTSAVSYYLLHITILKPQSPSVGYLITDNAQTYACASTTCPTRKLAQNTKVKIVGSILDSAGKVSMLQVQYSVRTATETRYIFVKDVRYISVGATIINTSGDKTVSKTVFYHSFPNDSSRAVSTAVTGNTNIATATKASGAVTIKRVAPGYTTLTTKVGADRYTSYSPVTVYSPTKYNYKGYLNAAADLFNGASSGAYPAAVAKLYKGNAVTIIGQTPGWFYIKTTIGKDTYRGFVPKSKVVYVELKQYTKTMNKTSTTTIGSILHNAPTGTKLSWKINNSNATINATTGLITPQREGKSLVWIQTSNGLAVSPTCYVSMYTAMGNPQGYMKQADDFRYCATDLASRPKKGTITQNTALTITGKCTDFFWVKRSDGTSGWVAKSKVVYITLDKYSLALYRYHTGTFSAFLNNSSSDHDIVWSNSNSSLASIKSSNGNNRKTVTITTNKPGSLTLAATYKYATINGKARYITAKTKVTIKDIYITLNKTSVSLEIKKYSEYGQPDKTVYPTYQLTAKIFTWPNEKVTWTSSDSGKVSVDKNGKIAAKRAGTATITARFKDITKSCRVTATEKAITLYASQYAYSFGTDYWAQGVRRLYEEVFTPTIDTSQDAINAATNFGNAGYKSYYNITPTFDYLNGNSPNTGEKRLSSPIVFFDGHGNYDNVMFNYHEKGGEYFTGVWIDPTGQSQKTKGYYVGIPSTPMTNVKLITFAACLTAEQGHGRNLCSAAIDKGAATAVGWSTEVYTTDLSPWLTRYTDSLSRGFTVAEAVTYANNFPDYEYDDMAHTVIYGSRTTTIR
ncbi:MAG: Ig-like domain-containing protein, partial [Coriobacteriia bacterium]|nr:Ig-like domain-containing protein [Coriobacteriia bacterium]